MSTAAARPVMRPAIAWRRWKSRMFAAACVVVSLIAVGVLVVLLARIFLDGRSALTWKFLKNMPSTLFPEECGVLPALAGTVWLLLLTGFVSIPSGIAAAVYLEEYARHTRLQRWIHLNIVNLAGVPSIVYGLLGLAIFVRWMSLGRSIFAGALTLSLLVLPVIIIASREAVAAVPSSIRHAAYALGATRWQTVRHHVLPAALPGIMTGVILALSRAVGETAPLIVVGAWAYTTTVPGSGWAEYPHGPLGLFHWLRADVLNAEFTALPIQIYDWCSRPDREFNQLASGGILVLMGVLVMFNSVAAGIRAWQQSRRNW